ncbi:MAG TPA: zinc metalloprotease HtpX [Candidatus Micrarchaeia archaeon]|nr:zinc metalloprotease HtpX [Candidatus Micrarchaeia archaeon]
MKRSIGSDHGLTLRMFLTMFLLAVVYLIFVGVLLRVGVPVAAIVVIAVVLLGAQYLFSDRLILASLGAEEVSEAQAPQLHATVARLAQLTDIPMPRVAIIQSRVPNALATGRDPKHALVAVTTAIQEQLEPREMEAVLAHELSHVIHRDMRVMAMASFFATVAAFIVQSSLWFGGGFGGGYGGGYGGRGRGGNNEQGSFILVVLVAAAVWAVSFVLIRTLSRYREYAADRGSAVITQEPSLLASALLKISGRMERIPSQDLRQMQAANALMLVPASVKGSLAELFSTHPSVEHRVARLQELESRLSR